MSQCIVDSSCASSLNEILFDLTLTNPTEHNTKIFKVNMEENLTLSSVTLRKKFLAKVSNKFYIYFNNKLHIKHFWLERKINKISRHCKVY